ncbi:MAG TPA: extracellular solute-binding protein [Candidatus Acidoferrales bacterium]|nr:extracellular solute-binding protein [Candidatus Acidoferrales bacterium]
MRRSFVPNRRTGLMAVLVLLVTGCAPVSGNTQGGTVSVVATWEGAEKDAFMAIVEPFEQRTGIVVKYTSTRDLSGKLWKGVATGDVPDVAGLPGPGEMQEFARAGALVDLNKAIDVAAYKAETAPAFVQLGTVDDQLVGVFTKSTVKGLIWFNPKMYTLGEPSTWTELLRNAAISARGTTKTWCVGLESGEASGWPGTDWIEDIVLRQGGPAVYDDWVAGKVRWTSPQIRAAFEAFGTVVAPSAVYGGSAAVVGTNFGDASTPMFSNPPGCIFTHQGSFMTSFFRGTSGAHDDEFDFFPFPAMDPRYGNSLIAAGDLFAMFHDTPQARALISYLAGAEAQSMIAKRGGALSPNVNVTYPDELSRRESALLQSASIVRFDASDLMPEAMNEAFWRATVDYARDPYQLDRILASLDDVQAQAYGTGPGGTGPAGTAPGQSSPGSTQR